MLRVLNGSGADITPASLGISVGRPHQLSIRHGRAARPGHFGHRQLQLPGERHGAARGAPVYRNFANREGEMYAQDSWRIKRNFTVTLVSLSTHAAGARSQRPADLHRPFPLATGSTSAAVLADQGQSIAGRRPRSLTCWPTRAAALSLSQEPAAARIVRLLAGRRAAGSGDSCSAGPVRVPSAPDSACTTTRSGSRWLPRSMPPRSVWPPRFPPRRTFYDSTQVPRFTGFNTFAGTAFAAGSKGRVPGDVSEHFRHHQFDRRQPEGALLDELSTSASGANSGTDSSCRVLTWDVSRGTL